MNNIDLSKSMPITCAFSCESKAYLITIRQQAAKIAELEKERASANLIIAKIANDIIDLDNIDQDSHQAVHCWDDIKEFALLTLGRCDS
jgi:hypothetical protein